MEAPSIQPDRRRCIVSPGQFGEQPHEASGSRAHREPRAALGLLGDPGASAADRRHERDRDVQLGHGDGTFAADTEYPTGDLPWAIALGDLDGDTDLDIVTADTESDTVSVLLGNGDGTFAAPTSLPLDVGVRGSGPALGDVDEDGALDIVVATFGQSSTRGVSLLLGHGDGTFEPAETVHAVEHGSDDALLVDVDGDAHLDLVTADSGTFTVSVSLGDGAGGFVPHASVITNPTRLDELTAADLDGDGYLDLVGAGGGNDVWVLLGAGDGTFGAPTGFFSGLNVRDVASADLNGDLVPDLATADVYRGTTILLGAGDGTFGAPTNFVGGEGLSVAIGDVNDDGRADVAQSSYTAYSAAPDLVKVLVNTTGLALPAPAGTAGPTGVTVSWSPPSDAAAAATVVGYQVTAYDGAYPYGPYAFGPTTTQVLTGLTNGRSYTVRVAAVNAVGAGPLSPHSAAVVAATGLLPPTVGTASAGSASATVTWTPPAADGGAPSPATS